MKIDNKVTMSQLLYSLSIEKRSFSCIYIYIQCIKSSNQLSERFSRDRVYYTVDCLHSTGDFNENTENIQGK